MRADRRQLMLGAVLVAASAAVPLLRPQAVARPLPPAFLDRAIPRRIGRYDFANASDVVMPAAEEMTSRSYDQLLTRLYIAPGEPPIMLLIAYTDAQDAGLALHRPEACYPSSGYHIDHRATVPLAGIPGAQASILTAERGPKVEQVYTWMRIGSRFPVSAMTEKLAVLASNVQGDRPDGVLVRLSVSDPDRPGALARLLAFNAMLLRAAAPAARPVLIGRSA